MNAPGRCPVCRSAVRYEGQRIHAYDADGELHVCQVPPPLRFLECYCGAVVLIDDRTGERYNTGGNLDPHEHEPSRCEEAPIDDLPPPITDSDQPPTRRGDPMPRRTDPVPQPFTGVSVAIDEI